MAGNFNVFIMISEGPLSFLLSGDTRAWVSMPEFREGRNCPAIAYSHSRFFRCSSSNDDISEPVAPDPCFILGSGANLFLISVVTINIVNILKARNYFPFIINVRAIIGQDTMAKRPPRGKCVHCLAADVDRTRDHVFPRSWYPDTTPPDIYKWQIPSCLSCNEDYGRLEEDLLLRLALCIEPQIQATSGIVNKALRSMKPEFAKNGRDKAARTAKATWLRKELLSGPDIPISAVYPGLGERWGRSSQESLGIRVPAKSFRCLTEKIVRGIYYLEDQMFIEPPLTIKFYALTDVGAERFKAILERFGCKYAQEPGIVVWCAVPEDAPMNGIFEIQIWEQFNIYASVDTSSPNQANAADVKRRAAD